MLAASIGQRVFHNVERHTQCHKYRARHFAPAPVVVAHGTIGHGAPADAVVRLNSSIHLQHLVGSARRCELSAAIAERQFCFGNVLALILRQGSGVAPCQPGA